MNHLPSSKKLKKNWNVETSAVVTNSLGFDLEIIGPGCYSNCYVC